MINGQEGKEEIENKVAGLDDVQDGLSGMGVRTWTRQAEDRGTRGEGIVTVKTYLESLRPRVSKQV